LLSVGDVAAAEGRTGEQVYRQMCASCHGATGEGTAAKYPHPLVGNRSVGQLTRYITKNMPEDAPGKCVGEDAQKVAAFIYDAFYSKAAQARNRPPRIDLAHLTVGQYRNAVADLVGSFRSPGRWDEQRGLQGEYFPTRRFRKGKPALERRDSTVQFDFGKGSPDAKIQAKEFAIRWQGSVLVPETGDYEFIVRTDNAARLWVNAADRPLIDAWVKSGKDTEFRGTIYLLGGRAYPLRLEYFKSDKEKTASVELLWKVPHQAEAVIPGRDLSPHRAPETLVVTTPFPPDDRSVGYERGTSVSRDWVDATRDASLEVATYAVAHLAELAGVPQGAGDRSAKVRQFCRTFAERAFRRPLTEDQRKLLVGRQFEGGRDPETAARRVVLLVLNSPHLLYPEIDGSPDAYDVASRLSFGLWDSLPDRALLEAAAAGRLATREQVARQAERMLSDLRARAKLRQFFLQWLKVDPPPDLAHDPKLFPGFNQALASDLRTSLELFLEDVVWGEASDFRQLLQADYLYLNSRLARFYGLDLPADAPFQRVVLDPGRRAGVLSHPYVMATFAYTQTSSPIHRGVFLVRNVLGQALRPPPQAFAPLAPDLHPDLTTRERTILQTKPQSCQSCHGVINPLGFALENFDAVGRFRDREKGKPIDATGTYQTRGGAVVKFTGARELATFLAGSEEVHDALVEHLFHHLVRQPVQAYGPGQLAELRRFFAGQGFSIRKLVVEIMAASALKPRALAPEPHAAARAGDAKRGTAGPARAGGR
jgi:mono/diheme cytochrome c family protein